MSDSGFPVKQPTNFLKVQGLAGYPYSISVSSNFKAKRTFTNEFQCSNKKKATCKNECDITPL